ncbi:1,4-alpha-glucan branching protein GlgB [Allorhizocola rhizosphaerae]|uniref:1,4-alpha-glucan branching protein GlgB n=1 Tax=Allorhizocola rhizosphaerae TaxID=1872709 RepID=UPI000E3B5CA2|nr:1,4-alpha-glucan branching protein GlgB [Allorhizocola rhizosphaerae]
MKLWHRLGAHPVPEGWRFAVWAPRAQQVQVIGDFSGWWPDDGIPLSRGDDGVWTGSVSGAVAGQRYRYRVLGCDGRWVYRSDPLAFAAECPPANASVLYAGDYAWGDEAWMAARPTDHHRRPMSIYEVHLGSWRQGLSYKELADELVAYVVELGFTHVEFLPVMEHPFGGSWGYQVTGFYAPTARFGTPDELRHLIDRLHQAGIGVLMDWVPAHFPRDDWALARFDGACLYEHPDPRRGEHPDWGSLVFDYGNPMVREFLISNALYWCEEFHVDGLRVDAVASMLYLDYSRGYGQWEPNCFGGNTNLEAVDFLKELNYRVYTEHPGVVMIAEESTAWGGVTKPVDWGGLGFGLKWNMGWMHDTLSYLEREPLFRRYHHHTLTWPAFYASHEHFVLVLSHDEVVHGKRALVAKLPGDRWNRLAGLRGTLAYMWAFPGKKLLFMGAELAQEWEWSPDGHLAWDYADPFIGALVRDLNGLYKKLPDLWPDDGFRWLHEDASGNTVAFARGDGVVCVANFSGIHQNVYLPSVRGWHEALNTDAACYGGSGAGNLGVIRGNTVQLGPHAVIWLVCEGFA